MKPEDLSAGALEAFNESLRVSGQDPIELYALSAAIAAAVSHEEATGGSAGVSTPAGPPEADGRLPVAAKRPMDKTHRLFLEGARRDPDPTGGFDIWWASVRHRLAADLLEDMQDHLSILRDAARRAYNSGFADAAQVAYEMLKKDIGQADPEVCRSCEVHDISAFCVVCLSGEHSRDAHRERWHAAGHPGCKAGNGS